MQLQLSARDFYVQQYIDDNNCRVIVKSKRKSWTQLKAIAEVTADRKRRNYVSIAILSVFEKFSSRLSYLEVLVKWKSCWHRFWNLSLTIFTVMWMRCETFCCCYYFILDEKNNGITSCACAFAQHIKYAWKICRKLFFIQILFELNESMMMVLLKIALVFSSCCFHL